MDSVILLAGDVRREANGQDKFDLNMAQSTIDVHEPRESHDLLAEIDDYIENINENFAAYSRLNVVSPNQSLAQPKVTRSALKLSSKCLYDGDIEPSTEHAELFGTSSGCAGDFNHMHMKESNAKDKSFIYSHKKYLAKSRNFANQRKDLTHVSAVCVHVTEPADDVESVSEEDCESNEKSDNVSSSDVAVANNDSSCEKEICSKGLVRSKAVKGSRHTLLHSPVSTDGTSNLSTVDTDSQMLQHATPVSVGLYDRQSNSGDEITFV